MRTSLILIAMIVGLQTEDPFGDFLDANYKYGCKGLLELFYENINYPALARSKCRIGKLKVKLVISKGGDPKFEIINELGYGIEHDVTRVLKMTTNNWNKADSSRTLNFTIAYQLGEDPKIEGDIKVTGYSVENPDASFCDGNEIVMENLLKLLKKKKYRSALKASEELLRRDPDSQHYSQLNQLILKEMKK